MNKQTRQKIKSIDLYEFMRQVHGDEIKAYPNWLTLKCNPSINIHKGTATWKDYGGDNDYGDAISLLTEHFGYTFSEAVREIIEWINEGTVPLIEPRVRKESAREPTETKRGDWEFKLPEENQTTQRQMKAYLIKRRGFPPELVELLQQYKYIYQSTIDYHGRDIHNVVFTTPDQNFYEIHGTNSSGPVFHQSKSKTENDCFVLRDCEHASDKPKTIYITECSIDAISLFALQRIESNGTRTNACYVGLGGIAKVQPMLHLQELYPEAEIVSAVDNDAAGDKFREHFKAFKAIVSKNKDWNDDLKELMEKKGN